MWVYYLLPCFCYIFIAVTEKEVGTNKIEAKNKHRVNQEFNNAIHNEIIENKWLSLSDESINLVQTILFKNFPPISDFEDTTFGPLNMFCVQTGEFVQVLYENNHWFKVSSPTESAISVVYLYDSLHKESLNKNLFKQIARLRKVKMQTGRASHNFKSGAATRKWVWLRNFCNSFCNRYRSHNKQNELNVEKKLHIASRPLYYKCPVPLFEDDLKENKGFFMAFCSVCREWYHKRCENILVAIFRDERKAAVWKCLKCK